MAENTVKSFGFFASFHKQLEFLSDERAGRMVKAMGSYAFNGVVPEFGADDTVCALLWAGFKPIIDNSIKARRDGKKGGRPRNQQPEAKPKNAENGEKGGFNPALPDNETGVETDRNNPIPSNPIPSDTIQGNEEATSSFSGETQFNESDQRFITTQCARLKALGYDESQTRRWLECLIIEDGQAKARQEVEDFIRSEQTSDSETGELYPVDQEW